MADTYINIHLHIIFAVKSRDAMLSDEWRDELYAYIGGIAKNSGYVPVKIGGWRDHVHMLLGCGRQINISDLIKDIKLASSQWIQPKVKCAFFWQRGYGCFSISHNHVGAVAEYIEHQSEHHATTGMVDEFRTLCAKNGITFKNEYFFEDV